MSDSQTPCPFGPIIDRASQNERPSREVLDECFTHLVTTACEECLRRAPTSWIELLESVMEDPGVLSRSAAPGPFPPCPLTPDDLDRWFAHRPRAPFPELAEAALSLPLGERFQTVMTSREWTDTQHLVQLGIALDSLVQTQPPQAQELVQLASVFTVSVDPLPVDQPILWQLRLQATRSRLELALRQGDWGRLDHHGLCLTALLLINTDCAQLSETRNTMALHLLYKGNLRGARSMLAEAVQAAEEAEELGYAGKLLTNDAFVALLDGRRSDAETMARRAITLLSRPDALAAFHYLEDQKLLVRHAEDMLALATDPATTH